MSGGGGGGGRDDLSPGVGGGADQCGKSYIAPINSPKAAVLGPLAAGAVLDVDVLTSGSSSALVVKDAAGALAGALTFLGYLTVINCIVQQGIAYKATIQTITGGVYTVEVAPL
ncbi:hypothetical protein EH240_21685 [Mesorhizobium tamadayense]|jgi:hypothetical protein|uniref:Uncharacterized protein n=1 Tax=Mesorhizobium tamadayense TaxID=425306 RepID=A0A3P3FFG0_9HYPH|nr:hypothetical protein [Mesorhizobium tamadayense]RRH96906.1 hypothetical protein EH240_21685 [Mesorhizobium tamadayense]